MFLTQTPAKPLKFLQELGSQQLFRSSNMIEKISLDVLWALSHLLKTTAVMESLPYKYNNLEWH